jgi:hypothetical protein
VLVSEVVVESSESGARWLGKAYWQAVGHFTRGGVRARWTKDGGRLTLLGGARLLSFGLPELAFSEDVVSCRYAIQGGLLALRAGGSVTLAQRRADDEVELSVIVEEYGGHGIGTAMHEEPQVPNFRTGRPGRKLEAGLCLAIEPMFTLGGYDTRIQPDDWTVVTADGSLAAHFEHSIAVTENGPEILTVA